MIRSVDYLLIGGTALLLGGAVSSFLAVCLLRIYLACRYGILDHNRWVTYARNEAPDAFRAANFWMHRLLFIGLILVLVYLGFAALVFGFFRAA